MRVPQDIHQTIIEMIDCGRRFAVAVVLQAEGSTPRGVGAKAAVDVDGTIQGTIGGGQVEAETQRRAVEALQDGFPTVLDFNLECGTTADSEPTCGGKMRVLIDPSAARHRAAYEAAATTLKRRERGALLTRMRGSDPPEVSVEFLDEGSISQGPEFPGAEAILATLQHERPGRFVSQPTAAAERLEALVEPVIPRPVLLIIGGGHVGQALAMQSSLVGFDVAVIDDRAEFTRPALFPEGTATRCGKIADEVARFPLDDDTYVVIVTRGHEHDAQALAACLHRPTAYLGMIGSRRKVALMRKDFVASGRATAAEFDRVYAPIGLDVGSVTVPEIATSIVAQLIAVRRRGDAPRIPSR